MNLLRAIILLAATVLMAGGYAGSQLAFWNQRAADYHQRIDQPQIAMLALLIMVAAIAVSFVRDEAQPPGDGS